MPQRERLADRGFGVVSDVGCALKGDKAIAAARVLVDRSQDLGCAAYVLERDGEEQLTCIGDTGRRQRAQLVVVAVRSGDRLCEDRGVGCRAGDRVGVDQGRELTALEKVARQRVKPDRHSGIVETLQWVQVAARRAMGSAGFRG